MIGNQPFTRLGLVGAGRWGRNYISTISASPNAQLCRLASRSEQAHNLVDEHCTLSPDWRDVVEAGDIDGLVLAVPPQVQVEIALHAIEAELPLLLEKPMATKLEDAIKIVEAAARHKVPVMVDHIYLFHPAYIALKHQLKDHSGIRSIRTLSGNAGPYRSTLPPLWDWAPHDIAMCLDLLDERPTTIEAHKLTSRHAPAPIGDVFQILLEFPSGITADITTGNAMSKKKREFIVECTDDSWVFDDLAAAKLTRHNTGRVKPIQIQEGQPLDAVLQTFISSLSEPEQITSGAAFSADVVAVIAAANEQLTS